MSFSGKMPGKKRNSYAFFYYLKTRRSPMNCNEKTSPAAIVAIVIIAMTLIYSVSCTHPFRQARGRQGYEKIPLKSMVIKKADGSMPMCAPVQ